MSKIEFPSKALFMCDGSKCGKHKEIKKYFKTTIKEHHLKKEIEIFKMECSDRCKNAPILYSQSENKWFDKVDLEQAKVIMAQLIP